MTRIKPPLSFKNQITETNFKNYHEIIIKNEKLDYQGRKKIDKKKYHLDRIFDVDYSNKDIFNCIGVPMIENFFKGLNSSFFVYGQTGSGKTFTTIGNKEEKGLTRYLLDALSQKTRFNKEYDYIKVSCVQLYNNKFFDIFNNNQEVKLLEDNKGKFNLKNCKEFYLKDTTSENLMNILENERKVGVSSENSLSSRSHLIIQINGKNNFISIIDMAGSEKAKNALQQSKQQMIENARINESILALKECIRAYKIKQKHIPFRKNYLTRVLKNIFTSNCSCFILSTISPDKHNVGDTINTLNYVSDMKHIHRTILQLRKRKQNNCEEYDESYVEKQNNLIKDYYKELKYSAENREMLFSNNMMNTIFKKELKTHLEKDMFLLQNLLKIL